MRVYYLGCTAGFEVIQYGRLQQQQDVICCHCSISRHSVRMGCNKCRLTGDVCEKRYAILQGSKGSMKFEVLTVVTRNITYCLCGCDPV